MNTMIAATLMEANQNSNAAYERADMRLTPVMTAIRARPISREEKAGNHAFRIFAPAIDFAFEEDQRFEGKLRLVTFEIAREDHHFDLTLQIFAGNDAHL